MHSIFHWKRVPARQHVSHIKTSHVWVQGADKLTLLQFMSQSQFKIVSQKQTIEMYFELVCCLVGLVNYPLASHQMYTILCHGEIL